MDQFIAKHADKIQGTLSCFDRVLFRGHLPFFSGYAMVTGGVAAIFIGAQFEYNRRTFGGLLENGYEYWNEVPTLGLFSVGRLIFFDVDLLFKAVSAPGITDVRRFLDSSNVGYYFTGLLGLRESSVLYSPFATVLIVLGGIDLLRNRCGAGGRVFGSLTIVTLGSLLGLFLPYYYQASRFFIPVIPLLGVLAATGVVGISTLGLRWSGSKVIKGCVLALGLLFFSDLSYTYVKEGAGSTERMHRGARFACATMYDSVTEDNAVIVSALDINYISHFVLRETDRMYLPLAREITYIERNSSVPSRHWRDLGLPVTEERPEVLSSLLQRGIPVYTDDLRENDFREAYEGLRALFDWEVAGRCLTFHVYRLAGEKNRVSTETAAY